jgi:hypothetical protein
MASAFTARIFTRASLRAYQSAARAPLLRTTQRTTIQAQAFRQQSRRGYAGESSSGSSGSSTWIWLLGAAAVGGGGYYAYSQGLFNASGNAAPKTFTPKFDDYQAVYDAVAKKLADETDYEDGSYGPIVLRLAWHASGTYVVHVFYKTTCGILTTRLVMTRNLELEAQTAQPCVFLLRSVMVLTQDLRLLRIFLNPSKVKPPLG